MIRKKQKGSEKWEQFTYDKRRKDKGMVGPDAWK